MSQNEQPKDPEAARKRATVIMQVRSGQITVAQAAKELNISRKTYYEWENRALEAMVEAMEKQPNGRPAKEIDPEKEALQKQVAELEKQLFVAKKTVEVRDLLAAYEKQKQKDGKKKQRD